jgi:hypothetical protein
MNKDEVIAKAQQFVKNKYPMVPSVSSIYHFTGGQPVGFEGWVLLPDYAASGNSIVGSLPVTESKDVELVG